MHKTRVAVLRGGPSAEYEVSLQTGSAVLKSLPDRYLGIDIFIDKNGVWHRGGEPLSPYQALSNIDVVFNALHGEYGEDGKLQREIEKMGVPYTGARTVGAALSMHKPLSKKKLQESGIRVLRSVEITVSDNISDLLFELFSRAPLPAVVKPASSGSSLGVTFTQSFEEVERGIKKAFLYSPTVLVEEYINGTEGTVGVIEGYRDEDIFSLSPVEIIPHGEPIFDYDGKYKGRAMQFSPSRFLPSDLERIKATAKAVHKALGLRHYSRTDFILNPDGLIYVLEVNALPALAPDSSYERSLKTGNIELSDFVGHVLSLALEKN